MYWLGNMALLQTGLSYNLFSYGNSLENLTVLNFFVAQEECLTATNK